MRPRLLGIKPEPEDVTVSDFVKQYLDRLTPTRAPSTGGRSAGRVVLTVRRAKKGAGDGVLCCVTSRRSVHVREQISMVDADGV